MSGFLKNMYEFSKGKVFFRDKLENPSFKKSMADWSLGEIKKDHLMTEIY
tara:strand:+ start:1095 stop:1244 length:150 start_codon:yes stop_codon:yes gene_type:complete